MFHAYSVGQTKPKPKTTLHPEPETLHPVDKELYNVSGGRGWVTGGFLEISSSYILSNFVLLW